MAFLSSLVISLFFATVYGHMGISNPVAREKAVVNDAYRYPNAGHCHGVGPGNAPVNHNAGSTVTLTLSSGAAHNGGHCALFLARHSDNEAVWFKQMDIIDCTNMASFDWTIDKNLVPDECGGTGCTLIWGWTPTSSGACEIYMNCFDVKINSATGLGGPSPSTPTVNKDPPCSRVDAQKRTSHFGTFCTGTGGSCGGAVTPTTAPPTVAGATLPPTDAPVTPISDAIPFRCGDGWVDANGRCGTECPSGTNAECPGNEGCFAGMTIPCAQPVVTAVPTAATFTGTTAPTPATPSVQTSNCQATGPWVGSAGMNVWCAANCPETCPESHCTCVAGGTFFSSLETPAYVPSCQEHTTGDNDTMSSIGHTYDLSSYEDDPKKATAADDAAQALLDYNKKCNDNLASAMISTVLPANTKVYITGDCQMTDKCAPVGSHPIMDDGSHASNNQLSLPIFAASILLTIAKVF